jgi:hypothetical protein
MTKPMPVRVSDHIRGATTLRPHVPTPLDRMLAAVDITAPVAGKIDLERLDAKLAGESIGRRLEIKCALRSAGMLD